MKSYNLKSQLKQKQLLLKLILWLIASYSFGVYANEKALLEEITVTARKTEENLQEVPISLTAFSSSDIEARRLADLEDIALNVPNVNFARNLGQAVISIRGIADDELLVTSDPLVGVYVDGVYVARQQGALLEMVDAERIEVLKGPQGTLFGKNTLGGAVSIISKKPQGEGDGYVKVTAGEDDRVNFQGSYDFGLTDDLSLKVSSLYKTRDCLTRRVNDNACMDDEDVKLFRAYANYEPSDDFNAALIVDGSWDDSHAQVYGVNVVEPTGLFILFYDSARADDPSLPAYNPVGVGEPYIVEGNGRTDDDIRSLGASLKLEWKVSDDLTIRSISAYRDLESKAYIHFDAFRETVFQNEPFRTTSEQFSQELILEGIAFDDRLNWLAGMYYFREDASSTSSLRLPVTFATGGWNQFINSEVDSAAGFGHLSYDLTDRIRVSAGIRYTSEKREFDARGELLATPGQNTFVSPVSSEGTFTAWTPKGTIDYMLTDDVMLYGSVSRGFRSGGFNGNTSTTNKNFLRFDPEFALNYEFGFKSTLWDQRVIFNTALYFTDYTDKQFSYALAQADGPPVSVRGNAAEAELLGVEAELKIALTEKLRVEAAFAYNDAEYTKLRDDALGLRVSLDSPFHYSPKYSGNVGIQFTEPDFAGIGDASFRVDTAYKSRVYFDPEVSGHEDPECAPFNSQEEYAKVNARITFVPHNTNWTLAAYGHNLTDKIIIERGLCFPVGGGGFDLTAYGQPREIGVEVRYDF